MEIPLIIIGVLVLIAIFAIIGIYNSLVQLRNRVDNAWSQIDVQLKRRHDLIPNIVETARGFMKHERETFESITQARSRAVEAKGPREASGAEGFLEQAIGRFMMVVENYPELKANQNFLALQEELSSTENRIGYARQAYNDQAMFYNNKIQMFPSNMVAGMFSFPKRDYFEIQNPEERNVPKVSF